ncbi:MAG TPA: protein-glutamate O-methyltransferase CheR [Planktothrix sp.]|jgi:chemotaxis protein methyltransferase CheR
MKAGPLPLDDTQVERLLTSIAQQYGIDFSEYAPASMRRRITVLLRNEHLTSLDALRDRVLADPLAMQRFVHGIAVNVTSMFRDPTFYLTFRREIVPKLATYPFIRIWHAGCSTGEEVYSTAIILHEEGLFDRARIYATDIDVLAIERAKLGIFPIETMKEYSANYLQSGGKESLSNYYTADQHNAIFRKYLKRNIVFAQHNLAGDGSFNEFHLILCRNVLIYFNSDLRERVLNLLHDSLRTFGVLGLGSKESLRLSPIRACYDEISEKDRLYKRVV